MGPEAAVVVADVDVEHVRATALPEEALVPRGGAIVRSPRVGADETGRVRHPGGRSLFGLTHLAGGPLYVLVASAAGVGYGWIYASTRSIGLAIVAHAGLNAVHLVLSAIRRWRQPP